VDERLLPKKEVKLCSHALLHLSVLCFIFTGDFQATIRTKRPWGKLQCFLKEEKRENDRLVGSGKKQQLVNETYKTVDIPTDNVALLLHIRSNVVTLLLHILADNVLARSNS